MRKILSSALLVILCVSTSFAEPGKKGGIIAPVGLDEAGIIEFNERVSKLDGKESQKVDRVFFFDNLTSMVMALRAGQIDRILISSVPAKYIISSNEDFAYINGRNKAVLGYAMAVTQEKRAVLMGINFAIFDMKADGTLERLMRKYILELGDKEPDPVALPVIHGEPTIKIAVTGDFPPMDCILADGTPAGFNTAFLAELSKRIKKNFQLVSIEAGARESALASGRVDMLFWTRGIYNDKGDRMPYPLDNFVNIAISEPYLLDTRAAIELKK